MLALLALLCLLFWPVAAHAWGPATHVSLAAAALEQIVPLGLPLTALLLRHRGHFLFGSVAADETIAKSLAPEERHCHRWEVAFRLLDAASDEPTRAFMWGYLCHLAADTVAHNLFVPHHLVAHAGQRAFSHAYWEVRADQLVQEADWELLVRLLGEDHGAGERHMARGLTPTLFSHGVSRRLFYGWLGVVTRPPWRRTLARVAIRSTWPITPVVLRPYRERALAHTVELLREGEEAACVRRLDPTGKAALAEAARLRRLLRRGGWSDAVAAYVPGQLDASPGNAGEPLPSDQPRRFIPCHGRRASCQAMEPPRTLYTSL